MLIILSPPCAHSGDSRWCMFCQRDFTEVVIFLSTELWQQSLSLISNCRNMSHLVGGKLFWPYQIIFKHAVSFVVTKTLKPQISKGAGTREKKKKFCNNNRTLQQNSECTSISAPGFTVTWITVILFRSGWLPKMRRSSYFPEIMLWQSASQHNLHTYPISKAKQKLPSSCWSSRHDLKCWEVFRSWPPLPPFFFKFLNIFFVSCQRAAFLISKDIILTFDCNGYPYVWAGE